MQFALRYQTILVAMAAFVVACDTTERDWENAKQANTTQSYQAFLSSHPTSKWTSDAKVQLHDAAWLAASQTKDPAKLADFIASFPGSVNINRARSLLREAKLLIAKKAKTSTAFLAFFDEYPSDRWDREAVREALGNEGAENLATTMLTRVRQSPGSLQDLDRLDHLFVNYSVLLDSLDRKSELRDILTSLEQRAASIIRETADTARLAIPQFQPSASTRPPASFTVHAPQPEQPIPTAVKIRLVPGKAVDLTADDINNTSQIPCEIVRTEQDQDLIVIESKSIPVLANYEPSALMAKGYISCITGLKSRFFGEGTIIRFVGEFKSLLGTTNSINGEGKENDKLTFILLRDKGLVYVRGRGHVSLSDGSEVDLPSQTKTTAAAATASSPASHPIASTTTASSEGVVTAGVFSLVKPAQFVQVTGQALERLRQGIQGGAKSLAQQSGMADPKDAASLASSFLVAYHTSDGSVTIAFMGQPIAQPDSIEKMLQAGRERVEWGIREGQLRPGSNVSRRDVDGSPCLLQNIEHSRGANMRTWLCFPTSMRNIQPSMTVICESKLACEQHQAEIERITSSVRIRKS